METFSLRGDQHTQEFFGGSGKGLEGLIGLPFRHIKRVFFSIQYRLVFGFLIQYFFLVWVLVDWFN